MAAITANEITYEITSRINAAPGRIRRRVKISFPTGPAEGTNNQYVAGGIALDKGKLGCPIQVQRLDVMGRTPAAGALNPAWAWNGDASAPKLVAYTADAEVANTFAFTVDQILFCEVEGY
jgi:hypothetical protein